MGLWSFQVGRAVVGVELPYKEWNLEKDPDLDPDPDPAVATINIT